MSRAKSTPPAKPVPAESKKDDVVLVHGPTDDGKGLAVIRKRGDELSAGEVRPLEEGKPITGDVVKLKPRPQAPMICDVDVQLEQKPSPATTQAGPARVSSAAYRSGWDRMWGQRRKREAN